MEKRLPQHINWLWADPSEIDITQFHPSFYWRDAYAVQPTLGDKWVIPSEPQADDWWRNSLAADGLYLPTFVSRYEIGFPVSPVTLLPLVPEAIAYVPEPPAPTTDPKNWTRETDFSFEYYEYYPIIGINKIAKSALYIQMYNPYINALSAQALEYTATNITSISNILDIYKPIRERPFPPLRGTYHMIAEWEDGTYYTTSIVMDSETELAGAPLDPEIRDLIFRSSLASRLREIFGQDNFWYAGCGPALLYYIYGTYLWLSLMPPYNYLEYFRRAFAVHAELRIVLDRLSLAATLRYMDLLSEYVSKGFAKPKLFWYSGLPSPTMTTKKGVIQNYVQLYDGSISFGFDAKHYYERSGPYTSFDRRTLDDYSKAGSIETDA